MREILESLGKRSSGKSITSLINTILSWYKDKDNISKSSYYKALEKEQSGKGSVNFFKHMTHLFELYMKLLNISSKSDDQESLDKAYREIGKLMNDILEVLIKE